MANIPSQQALPIFTEMLAAKYDEFKRITVNDFGRSFFAPDILKTRYIKTDTRRGSEKVALDVLLGHQGIRTQIAKSTTKDYDPFNFKYYFDATQLEIYWRMFPSSSWNTNDMREAADAIGQEVLINKQLIERAYELMCWQLFLTGTLTSYKNPSNPTTVSFHRKSASMVDLGSGEYWDTNASSADPFADMGAGGDFLRQTGLVQDFELTVIMGSAAYAAFINTDAYKNRALALRNLDNDFVKSSRKANGQVYHGNFSVGSYRVNVFTYNQFYEDPTGVSATKLSYMDSKKVVILPSVFDATDFKHFFIATPQLTYPGQNTLSLVAADYAYWEYLDLLAKAHLFYVESAGMPVPVAIDRMYTMTVHS